ncbi:MAG TPA: CCA tRNA nucleotidyltransferase [Acidimicrobiales bacterium]|nr:CCA tRNA nucleotidyltransferase [Acidimicrobiales bacterium]
MLVPERVRPLVAETAWLVDCFRPAGHRLYLVGGVVRDIVLNRPVHDVDLDITTDARPPEIKRLIRTKAEAVWDQGERFGTIGCRRNGRDFEITTHRAEAYSPDSRKPEVAFADAVEADLSRRDFTVNAMALRLPDLELVDPFDGLADITAKKLRTPISAVESFGDDPLRMLRAARFIAELQLQPEEQLVQAVRELHDRLSIVSAERIRDELDKLMVVDGDRIGSGLWFMVDSGLANQFVPELPALALEQDPIHRHKDVLAHTLAVVEKTSPDLVLRLAALFHDIGKPKTRSIGPGGVTFHHHEVVGARMTRDRMRALRYPSAVIDDVCRLVEMHLRFHTYKMGWTDSAVRRYVRDSGPLLGRLNELTRCDCTTRNARKAEALARRIDEFETRLAELQDKEGLAAVRPDLDGSQVMEHLGVPPGRVVGEALAYLLELRLDEGPLGDEVARNRLDEWWRLRQEPPEISCPPSAPG